MNLNNSFFALTLLFISCQKQLKENFDECTIYNLSQPTKVWKLPKQLKEISGIVILNGQKAICVNDEEGNLFIYDLNTKNIEQTIFFHKKGDYEDLAIKDSTAFVLRSDGTIFEVQNFMDSPKTVKHSTFLTKKDNAEGLFLDASKNQLLVACKGNSETKNESRFVYEFLLKNKRLNKNPFLTIQQKIVKAKYNFKKPFSPSGIAIHPISKNIYVLSSVGKMLAEFTSEGKLQKIYSLNYSHFQQPEGINFDEEGNFYISNEARKGKANILKFNYLL
ncbi:MAG: SdiA-regulated domain-containing protein [Lutibacter sp.]|uniref:SdiA-regulated domain-containing protein n=1 Tax=Lutibacter sp. TaxID=1925666 RepID=UPI00385FAE85